MASSELISEADLSNMEFDSLGIPSIEEETIFTHMQDDCAQVSASFRKGAHLLIQGFLFPCMRWCHSSKNNSAMSFDELWCKEK